MPLVLTSRFFAMRRLASSAEVARSGWIWRDAAAGAGAAVSASDDDDVCLSAFYTRKPTTFRQL